MQKTTSPSLKNRKTYQSSRRLATPLPPEERAASTTAPRRSLARPCKSLACVPSPESTATNVEVFVNVAFEEAGAYWVEILLDGDLKVRYPLRVNKVAKRAGNAPS